jgi:amino acid adenylation domain-containing protein
MSSHLGRELSMSTVFAGQNREAQHFPLSHAQRRLWFLHQLDPEGATYNIPLFLHLSGDLDRGALARSLTELTRRHESLRTTFPVRDSEPFQQVHPPRPVRFIQVELSLLSRQMRHAVTRSLRVSEALGAFSLERGPLVRASLLRLGEDEHELLLTLHHIISDGWSRNILLRELGILYDAFRRGVPPPLEEPDLQYADYSAWQQQPLQRELLEDQLDYWRRQLADLPPMKLPTDYMSTARSHPMGVLNFSLPQELVERLRSLARSEGATLFMVLAAAFQWLLGSYCRQDDIAIGTGVANRKQKEVENLVGFFVNTLVLRTGLGGDVSFRDLLRRVCRVASDAYAHADVPFERIVEELNPGRALGHTPLIQAMLVLEKAEGGEIRLPGLRVQEVEGHLQHSKLPLLLMLREGPGIVQGELQFATDLFRRESMRRLAQHFTKLLLRGASRPELPMTQLMLPDAGERQMILRKWNNTARAFPEFTCVQTMVEEQARLHPDSPAVDHGGARLSYRELNGRANRLAALLIDRGVSPEVCVGVCLERTPDMIVALLGILKAGGAYVPLDPNYPAERLQYMIDDLRINLLLTHTRARLDLPAGGTAMICLDEVEEEVGKRSDINPPVRGASDHLAYVTYTSGSTGKPKGIMVSHRAITRLVCNTNYVQLTAADRVAQAASISFDAATFEVWGALVHGATIVIIDRETVLDPALLREKLNEEKVSVLFLTTAVFHQMARDARGAFAGLRCLLFGGEVCEPKWVRHVLSDGAPRSLLHVYGPTETTTFATFFPVTMVDPTVSSLPIGSPITNTEIYILDRELNPVPVGMAGELYIGGEGLARGYWNRPGLTAEKFIPNLWGDPRRGRLYRTGDIARFENDGNIQFLGRADSQIKRRGFRIEIGEIECALREHPGVKEAVVVPSKDDSETQLIGFVVAREGQELLRRDIRQWLQERMPDYMRPGSIVLLKALPLTGSGKVDRRALLQSWMLGKADRTVVAPRTKIEGEICRIWAETLALSPISAEDNLFDLGGHSLMATRIVSSVRKQLGIEMPVRSVFEWPTVAQFARQVELQSSRQNTLAEPMLRANRNQ